MQLDGCCGQLKSVGVVAESRSWSIAKAFCAKAVRYLRLVRQSSALLSERAKRPRLRLTLS